MNCFAKKLIVLLLVERRVLVGCFDDVMFGCFGGVGLCVQWLSAMVGWGEIICLIGAIVRCGSGIWLLVVWVMLLVLCLGV